MLEADSTAAPATELGRGVPLRRLILRTHLPAVLGILLSLGLLASTAILMTFSVEPRVSRLRDAADAARDAHDAMLDQETSLRGFLAIGATDRGFLRPYLDGKTRTADADGRMIVALGGEESLLADAIAVVKAQQAWQDRWATPAMETAWTTEGVGDGRPSHAVVEHLRDGKAMFDDYRTADANLQEAIRSKITGAERDYHRALLSSMLALGLVGVVSLGAVARASRRVQRQVVGPILEVTDVVNRVAAGDLSPRRVVASTVDEVAGLSRGVATMTTVLSDRVHVAAEREGALRRHSERLECVLELSRGLSESLSLRYTSLRLLDAVRSLSGAEQADLWLRSRDRQELVRYDVTGEDARTVALDPDAAAADAVEVGIGAVGRAARYGRAIPLDESRDSRAEGADVSGIAIPLVVGSQVIGVLTLRPPAAGSLDLHLIDALILQGASALQAAQLHGDVEEQSRKDPLTGLANRRQFDEDLASSVARAARYDRPLTLAMIDLDHFKQVNDTYGHPRGDEVLQDVAGIILREVREFDTVYRYGGEELCVLLPETDADEAHELVERIRARVEASFPWARQSPVTLSAGVAQLCRGGDGPDVVGAADRALYAAKRRGRNCVVRSEEAASTV